ncbi:MAG: hypothetical protein ACYS99_03395 [Planctomycetota bacterium]|jgi:hypothetical protein
MGSEPERRGGLFRAWARARAAADRIPLSRPWRLRLVVVLSVTLAAVLGGPQVWPRTEEEKALAAVEDYVEAHVDGDFDEVWELETSGTRTSWEMSFEGLRKLRHLDPGFDETWREQEKLLGLTRLDVIVMSPREYFVAWHEAMEGYQDWLLDLIADAETLEVIVEGDKARVVCRGGPKGRLYFHLDKEDEEWRVVMLTVGEWRFRTLSRKMAAFLRKDPVDPAELDLVVEVGARGVDEGALERLRKRVRPAEDPGPDHPPLRVVLDAAPDLTWEDLIRVYDALHLEEVFEVYFAGSREGAYLDGIRVVPAVGHPAIARIISAGGPW